MVGVADFRRWFGGKDAKAFFFDVKFNFKVVKVFFIKMSFALSATITFVPFNNAFLSAD